MNTTPTPSITMEVFILDGAGETLVLLGIVVLETDLQIDSLQELTLLGLVGVFEQLGDTLLKSVLRHFPANGNQMIRQIFTD